MKHRNLTNNNDDSIWTEENSSILLGQKFGTFESKSDTSKLKNMQEKLTLFAERLCLRQRLQEILQSLESSDVLATQLYKINNLKDSHQSSLNKLLLEQQQFDNINLDGSINSGGTYDSHWRVLKIVEVTSQKLHHSLKSLLDKQKKKPQTQSTNPLRNILGSIENTNNQRFQSSQENENEFDQTFQISKEHQQHIQAMQSQFDQQINEYQNQINALEQEVYLLRTNTDDMQKYMTNLELEEKYLRDEKTRLELSLQAKEVELANSQKAAKKKKEYEQLVIKASQEMKKKEEDLEDKTQIIAKAQQVIVKLNEEMQKREDEKNQQMGQLEFEIGNIKQSYNQIMTEFQRLQEINDHQQRELNQQKEFYEDKLNHLQKKAEDIIRFFKNESQKAKECAGQRSSQFNTIKNENDRGSSKKSKSQVRFQPYNDIQSPGKLSTTNLKSTIGEQTPRGKLNFESSLNRRSSLKSLNNYEEDNDKKPYSSSSICTGIAMEAYEDTIKIMSKIRYQIQLVTSDFNDKILKQTEKGQELMSEYLEKIEQNLNKEKNLYNMIKKKDSQIRELKDINVQMKFALEEQRNHHQQCLQQLAQKEEMSKLLEDQNQDYIQVLKDQISQTITSYEYLKSENSKEKSLLIKKLEFQENNLRQLQQQLQSETEKTAQLESEIEKMFQSQEQEIQTRSVLQYQLDQVTEQIREIWQNDCEAFMVTNNFGKSYENQDSVFNQLKDIHEQLKAQKQMNDMQKEECYQILQQISEQNDMTNQMSNTNIGYINQKLMNGTQEGFSTSPSAQSMIQLRRGSAQSYNNSMVSKNLFSGQNTQVSKRTELYNMLREEIKRMQSELNQKSDIIVSYKKQWEKSDWAYRQKCEENEKLLSELKELGHEKDEIKSENHALSAEVLNLKQVVNERDEQAECLRNQIEQFERDVEILQQHMTEIINQNEQQCHEKAQWEGSYHELELRFQETNTHKHQLIDNYREKEDDLKCKIVKLKNKLAFKNQQIDELKDQLNQELRNIKQVQDFLEYKETNRHNIGIQSEPDQENIELYQNYNMVQQELEQVRHDITVVLNSYDVIKQDNIRINEKVEELQMELKKAIDEKLECEKLLEQEREFIYKLKKVEKSYSNIFGASQNNDVTHVTSKTQIFDYLDQQNDNENNNNYGELQQISEQIQKSRKFSQSQTRLKRNSTHATTIKGRDLITNQSNQNIDRQFQTNCYSQKTFFENNQDGKTHETAYSSNLNVRDPRMITSYDQSSVSSQIQFLNQQRPVSAFEFTHAHQSSQKENLQSQDNITINQQSEGLCKKDIKNLLKSKLKKRLKHFDSILGYLELQLQDSNLKQNDPPLLNRSSSVLKKQSGVKKQKNEEVLFYQAQSYMYNKCPSVYKRVQQLINSTIPIVRNNQDQHRMGYIQLSRKLTSLCLDGAILINSDSFYEALNKAQLFLQQESPQILNRFDQLLQINDQIMDGLVQIINQSSQLMTRPSNFMTQKNTIDLNKTHHQNHSSTDMTNSSIIQGETVILSPIQEQTILQKLIQVEARVKEKTEIFSRFQNYLQSNALGSLQRVDQKLSPEQVWVLICTLQRFCGAVKLDLSFDSITLGQLIKTLPKNANSFESNKDFNFKNDNLRSILMELESIKIDSQSTIDTHATLSSRQNDKLIDIITDYDKRFSKFNDRIVPNFIHRLIFKIRKEITQKNSIKNAIEEVQLNLQEQCNNQQNTAEIGFLTLLKENLELRKEIFAINQ